MYFRTQKHFLNNLKKRKKIKKIRPGQLIFSLNIKKTILRTFQKILSGFKEFLIEKNPHIGFHDYLENQSPWSLTLYKVHIKTCPFCIL